MFCREKVEIRRQAGANTKMGPMKKQHKNGANLSEQEKGHTVLGLSHLGFR
jgi:hypothetical protein